MAGDWLLEVSCGCFNNNGPHCAVQLRSTSKKLICGPAFLNWVFQVGGFVDVVASKFRYKGNEIL